MQDMKTAFYTLLGEETRADIEAAFRRLLKRSDELNIDKISTAAERKLAKIEDQEDTLPEVQNALKVGYSLLRILEAPSSEGHRETRIALSALEYLVDPWDVIPDQVPKYGLVDDGYVMVLANEEIETLRRQSEKDHVQVPTEIDIDDHQGHASEREKPIVEQLPPGAGQHLSSRAKELDMLNGYTRGALFNIGQQAMYGKRVSPKQNAFFDSLICRLVNQGILQSTCPKAPCRHCEALRKIAESGKLALSDTQT